MLGIGGPACVQRTGAESELVLGHVSSSWGAPLAWVLLESLCRRVGPCKQGDAAAMVGAGQPRAEKICSIASSDPSFCSDERSPSGRPS